MTIPEWVRKPIAHQYGSWNFFFNHNYHLFSSRLFLAMESPDSRKTPTSRPDPILLALFANRFMSVAEAMGRSLQQTSISTNIKERLDFSCALFAPDGDLVANAPFIPIHLGAMSL